MRLKRTTALLLAGLMILTSIPANTLQVYAEEETAITQETEGSSVTEESSSDAKETITSAEGGTEDPDVSSEDEMSEVITDDESDTEETSGSTEEATAAEEMTVTEEVTVTEESSKAEVALLGDATNLSDIKADSFAGGDGSEESPYLIATREQLALFVAGGPEPSKASSSYYALTADIDVGGYRWYRSPGYAGFDGRDFTISNVCLDDEMFADNKGILKNLKIKNVTDQYSLVLTNEGTISDVTVEDIITEVSEGKDKFLAVIAVTNKGTITDCVIKGSVETKCSSFAGFVSDNEENGTVDGCINEITEISVSDSGASYNHSAGIVRRNKGTVNKCKMNSSFSKDRSNYGFGGIVYENVYTGEISDCVTSSNVVFDICGNTGGIVYNNSGKIKGCINGADINSGSFAGGIAETGNGTSANGNFYSPSVEDCENTGSVSGKNGAAGIYCSTASNTITNCSNTGDIISSDGVAAGIVADSSHDKMIVIEGCINEGSITGSKQTAGIIAKSRNAELINCINTGDITGGSVVGGIVAEKSGSSSSERISISKCANIGSVSSTSTTATAVGGIGGSIRNFTMSESCFSGEITAKSSTDGAGGLIGSIGGSFTVTDCFANVEGSIESGNNGGLFGKYYYTGSDSVEQSVSRCYSVCNLENSSSHGGFAGYADNSLENFGISDCYILDNGDNVFGGMAHNKTGNVVKLDWFSMSSQESFVNYNFTDKWVMGSGSYAYPVLKWFPYVNGGGGNPIHDIALHDKGDENHYTANGFSYDLTSVTAVLKGEDETVYGYKWEPEGEKTILLLRQDNIPTGIMNELKTCNTLIFGNDITDVTISVMIDKSNDNTSLKKVELNKVKTIGKSSGTFAFGRCVNLDEVVNIGNLKYVSYGSFYMCKKLTAVDMPKCTYIGDQAFYECDSLVTVNVPKCEIIENSAFARCDELTTVDISGLDSTKGTSDDAGNNLNGRMAFENCPKLSSVTLGSKCTTLPDGIFQYAEGGNHDEMCALTDIDLQYIKKCGQYSLAGTSIENLTLPKCTEIGKGCFAWCKNLNTIEIPLVTTIKHQAFYENYQDLRIKGGSKVKTIEQGSSSENPTFWVNKTNTYKVTLDKDASDDLKKYKWNKANRTVIIEGSSSTTTGSVKSISLSDESLVLYSGDVSADYKVSVKAYLTPANTVDPEVTAAFTNDADAVVSAATVGSYSTADGYYPVEITLTGNTGKARVTVKETKSGVEAICTVNVKEKDKVYAPYSVNIQGDGSEYGDLVGLRTQTLGAQIFYVIDNIDNAESTVWDSVSWNDAKDKFESSSDSVREYKTPLVMGVDSDYTRFKLHAVAFKKNMISSDEEIFELAYFTRDEHRWGDVNGTDKDREFGGDVNKLETEEYQGIWAPKAQLHDESIVYTGKAITIPDLRIYFGNRLLKEKTDYTLKYSNNINSGDTAEIKVTLKGNYSGTKKLNFTINKRKLSADDLASGNVTYSAVTVNAKKDGELYKNLTPDPKIYVKTTGKKLKVNVDYTITYNRDHSDEFKSAVNEPGVYGICLADSAGSNYEFATEPEKRVFVDDVIYCIGGDKMVPMSKVTVSKVSAQKIEDWKDEEYTVAPAFTVKYKGKDLIPGDAGHYIYEYKNNNAAGTASLIISGTNKEVDGIILNGIKTVTFKISGIPVNKNNTVISGINAEYTYTGAERTPSHTVTYDGNKVLTKGVDYDVIYAGNKNTNAGKVNMTFKFKGIYSGSLKASFKIVPVDLTADDVSVTDMGFNDWKEETASFPYIKGGVKPEFRIRKGLGAVPVKLGKDYTVTYANNKAVGAYNAMKNGKRIGPSMTIKFKGNYKGNLTVYFTIEPEDIALGDMQLADLVASVSPNKFVQKAVITDQYGSALKSGTDYDKVLEYTYDEDVKVTYKTGKGKTARIVSVCRSKGDKVEKTDIIPAGTVIRVTASGIKNYTNSISDTYTIAPTALKTLKFSIDPAKTYTYTGRAITPGKDDIRIQKKDGSKWVSVTDAELAEYQEYFDIVGYKNNVKTGSGATITLRGKNGYAGSAAVKFKIVKRVKN